MIDFMLERLIKQFLNQNKYSFDNSLIEPYLLKINPPLSISYAEIEGGILANVEEEIERMPLLYDESTNRNFYFGSLAAGVTTFIYGKKEFPSSVLMLNTKSIELPVYCTLKIDSSSVKFTTSKTAYDELNVAKYQFFTDKIELTINNVSPESFIPFNLEFLKITPKP